MNSTREQRDEVASAKAAKLGKRFGLDHPYVEFAKEQDSESLYQAALELGCPMRFFDVFKYAVQEVWRRRGDLR